jgi:glucose/arabinose dehydrogenase
MKKHFWFLIIVPMLLVATAYGAPSQQSYLQRQLELISLPPGFEISIFAENVPGARSLEWTPNNTLFVGTRQAGLVYAMRDDNFDGTADGVVTIASGLYQPNGVAFLDGSLYVAEITRILRYDNIEQNLNNPPRPVVVLDGLPDAHHGWKFLRFGPDGMLYSQIGAPCNICNESDPRYATIFRFNPDGSGFEIYASGVRNTVGFDWHPETGALWFTDNGRDEMGDDVPSDELNTASEQGLHFGFPFCHQGDLPDPAFGGLRSCTEFTPPALKLGPHVAALGMRFYTGEQFPEDYLNQILIAEHGSWNRSVPIGYRVTLVRMSEDGKTPLSYEVFAEGWLQNGAAWGRPVDIEQLPDGSILVSDDYAGAIYRIQYIGEE